MGSVHSFRLQDELTRLAQFGANIVDAHSCFLFLPTEAAERLELAAESSSPNKAETLTLAAFHSLSRDVVAGCQIPTGSGIIGWVAKHARGIHVSPFERDSQVLGTYKAEQHLKCFLAVPVAIDGLDGEEERSAVGVLACDSRKAFAFTKLQGKLLQELASQVTTTIQLAAEISAHQSAQPDWTKFYDAAERLGEALGGRAIEALRIQIDSFEELENRQGTDAAIAILEQLIRLIRQAVPPHFPLFQLPDGNLLLVVDNMMTSYVESRVEAICAQVRGREHTPHVHFERIAHRGNIITRDSLRAMLTQRTQGQPQQATKRVAQ